MTAERLQGVSLSERLNALKSHCEVMVRDAMPATRTGATAFVPRYQLNDLAARLNDLTEAAAALSTHKRADGLPAEIGESLDKLADTIAWHLDAEAGKHAAQKAREDLATADDDRR